MQTEDRIWICSNSIIINKHMVLAGTSKPTIFLTTNLHSMFFSETFDRKDQCYGKCPEKCLNNINFKHLLHLAGQIVR